MYCKVRMQWHKLFLFIVIILYTLVKVTSVSPSLLSFFLNYFSFSYLPPSILQLFFLSHGVPFPPLSISPASEYLCLSIVTVDLFFAKLLLLYLSFTFLFDTYTAFPPVDSTCFSYAINRILGIRYLAY